MALRDPVVVYRAEDNLEAQLVCNLLSDAGIEARITDDSPPDVAVFGLAFEGNYPEVWTERSDVDRAKPVLDDYECQKVHRQEADAKKVAEEAATVEVRCEECGETSVFPAEQEGTVQECPHCSAYVDVGDVPDSEEE